VTVGGPCKRVRGVERGAGRPMAPLAALFAVLLPLVLLVACTAPAAPPPAPPPPTPAPQPSQIVVAVDDLGAGFNPHLLAHQSPVTTALAGLVLPSVFRPDVNGNPQLDKSIATSAEVTAQDPFTVTYELNLEASWTSNAPIAAEDFVYLWERMRDEPGVADAAGYRLITDVRSRAAGKAVDVVFAQPYPAWKTLFSDLLPAHLLKDAPGSWTGALANGVPASGGPFRVVSVDRARGEVVLTRNDQYWDTPAVLDQLVLRRLGGTALADGLGVGDVDIALPTPDDSVRTALGGLQPPPRIQTAPEPVVTELGLRTDGGPLADTRVRQALKGLVDRDAVRTAAAPDALAADSFATAPSLPGYASTEPTDRPDATALLTSAGWTRDDEGRWRDGGEPVQLIIGAAAERPADLAVARNVAAQLDAAGIETTVVAPTAVELFGQTVVPPTPPSTTTPPPPTSGAPTTVTPTATPSTETSAASATPTTAASPTPAPPAGVSVDLVVRPRVVGGDPATELASEYGCDDPANPNGPPGRPAVPTTCSSALQPLLDELIADPDGSNPGDTRKAVEKLLWSQVPALPLFQPVSLLVSTASADSGTGVGPGPLTTGPLTGAQRWTAPAR
jgi:ABC-type transport system substrate-binding protein